MDCTIVRKSRRRFLLIFCMFAFLFAITSVKINAEAKDIKYGVINEDDYRKTLCKGFWEKAMEQRLTVSDVIAVDIPKQHLDE